jgi:hypothetical protein
MPQSIRSGWPVRMGLALVALASLLIMGWSLALAPGRGTTSGC